MKVKRIVTNIEATDVAEAKRFYQDLLGMELLMDHGWIATYGTAETMRTQVSFASEGGSGTPVPDLSIEVDDVDEACLAHAGGRVSDRIRTKRMNLGGSEDFMSAIRSAKLVNILEHQ